MAWPHCICKIYNRLGHGARIVVHVAQQVDRGADGAGIARDEVGGFGLVDIGQGVEHAFGIVLLAVLDPRQAGFGGGDIAVDVGKAFHHAGLRQTAILPPFLEVVPSEGHGAQCRAGGVTGEGPRV